MDHYRMLGTLFIAWAVAQVVGVGLVLTGYAPNVHGSLGTLALVTAVLASIAYAWFGVMLRRHDGRIRVGAILLSVLALLSFPIGTAIGIYGLYTLLSRPAVTA